MGKTTNLWIKGTEGGKKIFIEGVRTRATIPLSRGGGGQTEGQALDEYPRSPLLIQRGLHEVVSRHLTRTQETRAITSKDGGRSLSRRISIARKRNQHNFPKKGNWDSETRS